jgi:hypothetical protein
MERACDREGILEALMLRLINSHEGSIHDFIPSGK